MKVRESQENALAEGTFHMYVAEYQRYIDFCKDFNLHPDLEADSMTLFLQFRSEDKLNPRTLTRINSNVRSMARLLGQQVPKNNPFEVQLFLRGYERAHPIPIKRAVPMTLSYMERYFPQVQFSDWLQFNCWVMMVLSFHALLRKSNVAYSAATSQNFLLTQEDILDRGSYMIVKVRLSKSNQSGRMVQEVPIVDIQSVASPVTNLRLLLACKEHLNHNWLFCDVHGHPISYYRYGKFLTHISSFLGVQKFTSHAMRRGGASYLLRKGVPELIIQKMGGWKSNCFKDYIVDDLDTKLTFLFQHLFS